MKCAHYADSCALQDEALQKGICIIKWTNFYQKKKSGLIISGVCSKYVVLLTLQQSSLFVFKVVQTFVRYVQRIKFYYCMRQTEQLFKECLEMCVHTCGFCVCTLSSRFF